MDTAINGFGAPLIPTTNYSQTLVVGSQLPANGPQPPPATIPAAISDSNVKDTFTPSEQASVLIASASGIKPPAPPAATAIPPAAASTTAVSSAPATTQTTATQAQNPSTAVVAQKTTSNSTTLQQVEQNQPPPPYTLQKITHDANKSDTRLNPQQPYSLFQLRQFSKLLNTLQSITSAVLPNFSFSA